MEDNIITLTDSYKMNHWNQYPKGTEYVYSYFESRKGAKWDTTVFFGLQYLLHRLEGFVVNRGKIEAAAELCRNHFGSDSMFNRQMWEHILKKHNGMLPIKIKAVPEGLPIPVGNVMMTVENTDPKCAALTNHLESYLTHVWASSTVATLSRECKKLIKQALDVSADNDGGLPFMLHDFGFRGVSSVESAGIEGAGHLINFKGTDTIRAFQTAVEYYQSDPIDTAFSVAATEHSIMTSLGRKRQFEVVDNLLDQYPSGILSVVSDSYDICDFVKVLGSKYKERILNRPGGSVFVVRPDSLTKELRTPEDEVLWIANQLWEDFGGLINTKKYKTINSKIRILWGDGIDIKGIHKILNVLLANNFSADNMAAFGMGGGLLQKINRDTQRFAFKSSAQYRDGKWHDVWKEPADASKKSKAGRMKLVEASDILDGYRTVPYNYPQDDEMNTVFENGQMKNEITFAQVRKNAELSDSKSH